MYPLKEMDPSLRISNSLISSRPCSATILSIWKFIFPKFSKTSSILILACVRIQWFLWRWSQFRLMNSSYFPTQLSSLISISLEKIVQNWIVSFLVFNTFRLERRISSLPFISSSVACVGHVSHCQDGMAGMAEFYFVFIGYNQLFSVKLIKFSKNCWPGQSCTYLSARRPWHWALQHRQVSRSEPRSSWSWQRWQLQWKNQLVMSSLLWTAPPQSSV